VRYRLLAVSGVTALLGTRIYVLKLPQSPSYPVALIQLVSLVDEYTHDGDAALGVSRVQVDVFAQEASGADPYATAVAAADAIHAALSGISFDGSGSPVDLEISGAFRMNRQTAYEPDALRVVRVLQDYRVQWRRPMA
jgi:hypothetical protein